jgi:enoyl-[acyl-carrier-protein] reductase (NADH)
LSKEGVLSMTREIATEFARKGIRTNAIRPGPMETLLTKTILANEEKRRRRLVHIPPGRFAQPREALFLASDESSFVNGATFTADGGITPAYLTPEWEEEGRARRFAPLFLVSHPSTLIAESPCAAGRPRPRH